MLKIARTIDALNENVGYYGAFLVLPLLGVVSYEVVMRYGFNAPTSWGFEATTFLYGVHFVLGLGYTHKHNGHVAIDVFEAKLEHRPRTLLRIVVNLIVFMPTMGLMAIWSVIYASTAWMQWEVASTSWAPPLYPFKTLMALGFVLLFLQGVAKLIQDFHSLQSSD
ncbi:MAG: TRAP transporter small permease subunit [Candidatus Competibacter sp.]|nr:TRAP transporter small permease subunit [Candidatus Competibacter sp.]MDG4585413.1 TRAP transporter small permease subunit [Candidatus Competibacter sp.]